MKQNKRDTNEMKNNLMDASKSLVGAIVGIALGGPVGSVIGAVTPHIISIIEEISIKAYERRKKDLQMLCLMRLNVLN